MAEITTMAVRAGRPDGRLLALAAGAALVLGGCARKQERHGSPPPPEVSVLTVGTEDVAVRTELPGRIHPVREAQVRARVTGILLKRAFEEGALVKEGEVLFQIDPKPLEAELNSAQAMSARTAATLKEAQARVDRYRDLVKIEAVSRQVYDEALATLGQTEAELLANQAAADLARLNLGYATVNAPISGRIGAALVTEGALVSATDATQLATIRQMDPVYLDITQSSSDVLKLRRAFAKGGLAAPAEANLEVLLEDGTVYAHPGRLLFSDIAVDPGTGMITLRALVPNPEQMLFPGMFARGLVTQGILTNVVTVPQRTVTRGPSGAASVLVVGPDKKVEVRKIRIERELEHKVAVAEGLRAGETIIVEGSQKAPPGTVVKTVPFQPEAAPAGGNGVVAAGK